MPVFRAPGKVTCDQRFVPLFYLLLQTPAEFLKEILVAAKKTRLKERNPCLKIALLQFQAVGNCSHTVTDVEAKIEKLMEKFLDGEACFHSLVSLGDKEHDIGVRGKAKLLSPVAAKCHERKRGLGRMDKLRVGFADLIVEDLRQLKSHPQAPCALLMQDGGGAKGLLKSTFERCFGVHT